MRSNLARSVSRNSLRSPLLVNPPTPCASPLPGYIEDTPNTEMKMSSLKQKVLSCIYSFENRKKIKCKIKDTANDSSDIYITFNYDKHADVKSRLVGSLKSDTMKLDISLDSEITVNQNSSDQNIAVHHRPNIAINSVNVDCQTDQDEIESVDSGFSDLNSSDEEKIISIRSSVSSRGKKNDKELEIYEDYNTAKPTLKKAKDFFSSVSSTGNQKVKELDIDENYKIATTSDKTKDFLNENHDENVSCQSDEKTVKSLIPISSEEQNTDEKLNLATCNCFDKSCLELRMSTFEKPITDIKSGLESVDTSDSSYQLHGQDDHEMNCSLLEQKEPFLDLPEILPDPVDDETSYKCLMLVSSDSKPDIPLPELNFSSGYPIMTNSTFRKGDDLTMSSYSMASNCPELTEKSEILNSNDPKLGEMTYSEILSAERNKALSAYESHRHSELCCAHSMMFEQNEVESGSKYNDKENTDSFAGRVLMSEHKMFLMVVVAHYWNRKMVKGRSEELNQSSENAYKVLMQTQGNCTLQTSFGIKRLVIFIKMGNDRYTLSDTMIVKLVYTYRLAFWNSLNLVSLIRSLQIEMICYMSDEDSCRSKALTGITSKNSQSINNDNIRKMQEAYLLTIILTYLKQKLLGRNVSSGVQSMNSSYMYKIKDTNLYENLEEFNMKGKSKTPHSSKIFLNKMMETECTSMLCLQNTREIQTTVSCDLELTVKTRKCSDIKGKEIEDTCAKITKEDAGSVEILKQPIIKDNLPHECWYVTGIKEVTFLCEANEMDEETCDTSDVCVRSIDNLTLGTTCPENLRDTAMTENDGSLMSIECQLRLVQHKIDGICSFDEEEKRKLSSQSADLVCSDITKADANENISKSEENKNDDHCKDMIVGGTVPNDDVAEGDEKESCDWNLDKNNVKETCKIGRDLCSYQADCSSKASLDLACLVGCNSIRQDLQDTSVSSSLDEVDIEEKEIDENNVKLESDSIREWRYTGQLLQCRIPIFKDKNSKKESLQKCHTRRKPKKSRKYFCGFCHKSREAPNKYCKFHENHKNGKRTNKRALAEIRNSSSLFDSGFASLVSSVFSFHSSYESTKSQFSSLPLPLTKRIDSAKYSKENDQLQLLKRAIDILRQHEKDLQLRMKQIVRSLRSLRPADIIAFPGLGGLDSYFTRVQNEGELSANERYRHEWVRFQSFDRYAGNGSGIILARNGFYHDSTSGPTVTRCFECGATHSDWQYFDTPQDRHNRNCPHRNGNSPRNIPIHEEEDGARAVSTPGLNLADSTAASSSSTASASRTASRGESGSAAGATSIETHAATSTINQTEEKYSYQPTTDADNTEYTSTYVVPSDEDSDQEEATQPTPSTANRAGLSLSSSTITSGGSGRNNSPITASKQRHHGDMGGDSSINTASAAFRGSDLSLPATPQASPASPLSPPSGQLSAPSDPAAPSLLATSGQPIEASRPVQIELSEEAVSQLPLETLGQVQTHPELIVVDTPKHPDHLTVQSRAATFKPPWPSHLDQTPRRMAEAGLFYSGVADFTRCYACGGGLRNWESGDDPVIEHTRWYPECQYVKKLKGEKYVKAVTAKQQKHLEERRQQQQQQIARREQQRQRQPPDALRTQAASILTEMGYPQERIRDAIEDVRRHTGRMEVSAEQALLWIIDDEERRARIAEQRAAGPAAFHTHVPARSPVTISSSSSSSSGSSGSSRSLLSASPSESPNTSRNTPGTSTATSSSVGSRKPSSTATSSSVPAESQQGAAGGPESDEESSSKGNDAQPSKGKSAKRRKKKKKAGERPATAVSGAATGPSDFDTESLKQENEKLREIQTCKICLDKAVDTTFLPCGHLVCCSGCAGKMRKCPICRELVRGLVRTYMS